MSTIGLVLVSKDAVLKAFADSTDNAALIGAANQISNIARVQPTAAFVADSDEYIRALFDMLANPDAEMKIKPAMLSATAAISSALGLGNT